MNITEDYVSFEVAKLLKEKGFDEFTFSDYNENGIAQFNEVETRVAKGYQRPTLQMALKWLREVHNIDICAFPYQADYILYSYNVKIYKDKEIYLTITDSKTYEEAVETALKYCLKNLT